MQIKTSLAAAIVILALSWTTGAAAEQQQNTSGDATASENESFSPFVDAKGNITRPQSFREDWVHIGSWFVGKDDQASGPGVHDVYADPSAVKAFQADGKWPDGAVLVKEIRGIKEGPKTTGHAQWAGDIGVWFVMVRDRQNRFPDNTAWGEGWGWALFTPDSPNTSTTDNWKGEGFNNCFGCHVPAKDTEWVFIEGYPTVRDAAKYDTQ